MNPLDHTIAELGSDYVDGYGTTSIPSPIDTRVKQLIRAIADADRADIASQLGQTHGLVLLAFAERMSSLAIRQESAELLDSAVSAIYIATHLLDLKEVLPVMWLIGCSADKLGLSLDELFLTADLQHASGVQRQVESYVNLTP